MANFYPSAPTGVITSYFGDSGGATSRYYWVQAIYPSGRSILSTAALATTPAALSARNVVLIRWDATPGAIGYNVFKTATSTAPVTGAVGVAMNIDTNSFTDDGDSDSLLTVPLWVDALSGLGVARARWDFATDGGAISTITPGASFNTVIPKNAIMIGGTVNVLIAGVGASGTLGIGTSAGSSTTAILAATAVASLTLNALINAVPVFATPVKMSADGSITFTIATTAFTAGRIEVFVLYLMPGA